MESSLLYRLSLELREQIYQEYCTSFQELSLTGKHIMPHIRAKTTRKGPRPLRAAELVYDGSQVAATLPTPSIPSTARFQTDRTRGKQSLLAGTNRCFRDRALELSFQG